MTVSFWSYRASSAHTIRLVTFPSELNFSRCWKPSLDFFFQTLKNQPWQCHCSRVTSHCQRGAVHWPIDASRRWRLHLKPPDFRHQFLTGKLSKWAHRKWRQCYASAEPRQSCHTRPALTGAWCRRDPMRRRLSTMGFLPEEKITYKDLQVHKLTFSAKSSRVNCSCCQKTRSAKTPSWLRWSRFWTVFTVTWWLLASSASMKNRARVPSFGGSERWTLSDPVRPMPSRHIARSTFFRVNLI